MARRRPALPRSPWRQRGRRTPLAAPATAPVPDHTAPPDPAPAPAEGYAELQALSHFSFQRGASSAAELCERAQALGYAALALTDECTLAGAVRALQAAERVGLKLIIGSEFRLVDGLKLVLLCADHGGYSALCHLITVARRAAPKGGYRLERTQLAALAHPGLLALWVPEPEARSAHDAQLAWVAACFPGRTWIAVHRHLTPAQEMDPGTLAQLALRHGVRAVACGDVHMHLRRRRALQDCLTAIRLGLPVAQCGRALFANGERHLRRLPVLRRLYSAAELAETLAVAARCSFSLREVKYRYPRELVPPGRTPTAHLRTLTETGARQRWPEGVRPDHRALIEKELALIAELEYEAFFLTVHDVVRWARSQNILCQGRGSAANSIVCYCLGITAVDPDRIQMLFERFVSKERNEAPDIDVDFEHERREEVLQYIYGKYGRERCALAATVSCYRSRSAARDLARALGFGEDQVEQLARVYAWGQHEVPITERLAEHGFAPDSPPLKRFRLLLAELVDAPRHLSQHVGGFIISDAPLWELVPVENAAMAERTVIQWDKDDLEYLGLLKVDCLALGMLSCLRKCFALVEAHRGIRHGLASIPEGDPSTYAMIQAADTVGVFQIESRAQMTMLPRLKPACFYDLVIETAIVRPGPIQGDMVNPYLKRRQGLEPVTYPSEEVRHVLQRTLGIPLFQEQVMALLQVAAGFTPGESDQLRRSMAAWKRNGGLEHFRARIFSGLAERGYKAEYAQRIFDQILGFGSYGFPESHAASFALLAYVSSWLKCHEPAAFACALLNSLPMGFYGPAQIVADLRRHQVQVLPVDVLHSDWDHTLVPDPEQSHGGLALRLGLRVVGGLREAQVTALQQSRTLRAFTRVADLVDHAGLDARSCRLLAAAGALRSLAGHRHRAFWDIAALDASDHTGRLLLGHEPPAASDADLALRTPSLHEDIHHDYARLGLSLEQHPLSLVRAQLRARHCLRSDQLARRSDGCTVRFAGLVTLRQRPATASGVTFVTLEDEAGLVNLIVWHALGLAQRRELIDSQLLGVEGQLQRQDGVQHIVARRLHDWSALLPELKTGSRDFR